MMNPDSWAPVEPVASLVSTARVRRLWPQSERFARVTASSSTA